MTSRPARLTSDTPIGKVYSSSGTSPLTPYSRACSMNMTGLSDRIAVFSRPLASYGVAGITTINPGTWANQASRLCEWVAASCPQPAGVRITSGTFAWPPNMEWIFADVVDDLVHRHQAEIDRHQLRDRSQTAHRRPDGGTDDRFLRDRRVDDPLVAEFAVQPAGDRVGSPPHAHLFPHDEDVFGHGASLPATLPGWHRDKSSETWLPYSATSTSAYSSPGSGSGLDSGEPNRRLHLDFDLVHDLSQIGFRRQVVFQDGCAARARSDRASSPLRLPPWCDSVADRPSSGRESDTSSPRSVAGRRRPGPFRPSGARRPARRGRRSRRSVPPGCRRRTPSCRHR